MNAQITEAITALRARLHALAELSGQEVQTKAALMDFLRTHTTLTLHECGAGFYAAHRETDCVKPSVMLRADYDALATPSGCPSHLCGHDGHSAALCGVAMAIEGRQLGRNIFLLFQPAEETGEGAAPCCELFEKELVDAVYGCHNLPGFAFGKVYTKPGTFACASRGVTIRFAGKPTHAAYPELGISPAPAVGALLCELPSLSASEKYTGMTLCTVIGVEMGEKAFGAAAEKAEVWLTLRGEHDTDLDRLQRSVLDRAAGLAAETGTVFSWAEQDVFPSTENTPDHAERILSLTHGEVLPVPMRWSEDFGHYLKQKPGAFFGIGAGEDWPGLHTEHYEYPDALLSPTADTFLQVLEG